ncbi:MAG: hypothetical protein ABIP48_12705, partial [Planctomycetota bacterium]
MPSFQVVLKRVLIVAAALLSVLLLCWLLYWLVLGGTVFAAYGYYLRILTTEGGMDAWLARAISLLFAIPLFLGLRFVFSRDKKRRTIGCVLILGMCFAFNLFVYGWTRSGVALEEGQHFVQATGQPKVWYCISESGQWELFPKPGFHPRTGQRLNPMTIEANELYEAWTHEKENEAVRQKELEAHERTEAEERQFRETHISDLGILSGSDLANVVILAIKTEDPNTQVDILRGHIAQLVERRGKEPISTLFKPAFYDSGLFDRLWD